MLRKRLPNQNFSPRLAATVTSAAEPLDFNEVNEILIEAGVTTSYDLSRIHRGSWHDTILSIENLANRKCTSAESATIRVTVDALCSGRGPNQHTSEIEIRHPQDATADEPRTGQRKQNPHDDAFFDYKKYTVADHDDARAAVKSVAEMFAEQSKFAQEARNAGRSPNEIFRVLDAAIRASIRSPKTITMYAKHAAAFHEHLEEVGAPQDQRTGSAAIFHLFNFLEKRAGTTVPATIRCALRTFAEALQIDWNLDSRALVNICQKPDAEPKQAPMLKLSHIKFFETTAANNEKPFPERLFAANFALMCHASLRYDDTKSISHLTRQDGKIEGRINAPKVNTPDTKRFICEVKGFSTDEWSSPILRFREGYALKRTYHPSFLFPKVSENGSKVLERSATRAEVTSAFRNMIRKSGDPSPDIYTLHSPRNWYTSAAAQLGWTCKAQTTLGRWGDESKMPNRYNRQKGTVELSVRADIVSRVRDGWTPADDKATIQKPPVPKKRHALRADDAYLEDRERLSLGNARVGGER